MDTLPTGLLDRAWSICREAQIFYADLLLREYYSKGGRLEIRRLSGALLDMAQCCINISIIKHTWENDKQLSEDTERQDLQILPLSAA